MADGKEIRWEPRRAQIYLHEDRNGDVHARIELQPSGRTVHTVFERDSRRPLSSALGAVGLVMHEMEQSGWKAPHE